MLFKAVNSLSFLTMLLLPSLIPHDEKSQDEKVIAESLMEISNWSVGGTFSTWFFSKDVCARVCLGVY